MAKKRNKFLITIEFKGDEAIISLVIAIGKLMMVSCTIVD